MPAGRPSLFSQELAEEICNRIAEGESLHKICRDESMPSRMTIHRWRTANKEFSDQLAHAREDQADFYADEIIEITDRDDLDPHDKRVRTENRFKIAAVLKPKVYGTRVTQEHQGTIKLLVAETDPDVL